MAELLEIRHAENTNLNPEKVFNLFHARPWPLCVHRVLKKIVGKF